ncbi:MAG: Uma2 family endonuclease [Ktedonobacteraceae bacterium]
MAPERQPQPISVAEYFALEENAAGICYEYVDGYAYMMAGGSFNHDAIKSNIQRIIGNFLLESDRCNVYSSDMKTQVAEKRYYHPDVVITCDPRDQGTGDLLKYPRVIFEVLSPSTERVDHTRKMRDYLALPTVEEYMLVDSRAYRVEMYRREGKKWIYSVFEFVDELELASVDLHFPVTAVYAKVQLVPEDIEDEDE